MYIAHIWCMYHVSFGRGCAAPTLRTQPMAQSCTDLNITIYKEMHLKPTMFYIQYYPAAKVEKQSLQPIIIYNHVCWCGLVETYHTALHCNKCEIVMTKPRRMHTSFRVTTLQPLASQAKHPVLLGAEAKSTSEDTCTTERWSLWYSKMTVSKIHNPW